MSMTLKVAYCDYPHARPIPPPDPNGTGNTANATHQWEIRNDDGSPVGGTGLGPANEVTAWLSDVKQVTTLGQFPANLGSDIGEQYLRVELWAWAGDRPQRYGELIPVNTLIMVRFADDDIRTLLVERAWLLSESGQTIERIAP